MAGPNPEVAQGAIAAVLGAALIAGCASSRPPRAPAPPPPAAAASRSSIDDWRALILVPFGTQLKDMPIALTEVLTFHDAQGAAPDADEGDCYTMQGVSSPQYLGRRPDEYRLCFSHDRLIGIHAVLKVPEADAAALLARACSQWPGGEERSAAPDRCAGRVGSTGQDARIIPDESADAMSAVSVDLIDRGP